MTRAAQKKTGPKRAGRTLPLDRLMGLGSELNLDKSSRDFHTWLLRQVRTALPFDAATIYTPNDDGSLREAASIGGPVEIVDFVSIAGGKGISGWTAYDRRPVVISRRALPERLDDERGFDSFMSIPMLTGGEVVGVLNLARRLPGCFCQADIPAGTTLSSALGTYLAVYRLHHQRQGLQDQLAALQLEVSGPERDQDLESDIMTAADLAGRLAHAINDPLAVIVGHLQCLLAERAAPDQKTLSRLRRAEAAALSIADKNRDLLAIHALGTKHARGSRKGPSHD